MKQIDPADKLVQNIMNYSSKNGDLLNKYNLPFFLHYFDRHNILSIKKNIETHSTLTQQQFIRLFLIQIEHTENQTLYLALSLKQLFQAILERTSNTNCIEFSDFTNYLCQKIAKQDLDLVVPAKKIAKESLTSDSHLIREIDIQAPIIMTKVPFQIPKLNKDFQRKNKKLQGKKNISNFFYSHENKQIITSGVLSSSIIIYNDQLKKSQVISPRECKQLEKDIGIISMAYNASNNRIGAILTNSTMIFWEGLDNYTTEKIIINKNYGDKIYYMDLTNQWITVDKCSLNFWDIKEEKIINTIKCKDSSFISDICYINHVRGICASVTTIKQQKFLYIYRESKLMARINLGNTGCHTLHYNKLTQSLIPLGYTNILSVYTVEGVQYDIQLKYILRGHRSIITCIDSLDYNTLMITGDDIGEIKIWQLTYMRCIQSVKISKWLNNIMLIGNKLYYSDTRINFMQLEHFEIPQIEKPSIIHEFYDKNQEFLWVFTKKDVRKIDIKRGKVMKIVVFCNDQEQISSALALGDGFAIGNSKGQLYHYDSDCNLKWRKQAHQGQIVKLLYDSQNRLIFSLGVDNKILVWPERTAEKQEYRKSITYKDRQINLMQISNKNTMLLLANLQEKQLYIWDYQILKFHKIIKFQEEIILFTISNQLNLIIIVTLSHIYFIKYIKRQNILQLQIINKMQISDYLGQNELITAISIIIDGQQTDQLILGTNKGQILNIDIKKLIEKYFRNDRNKTTQRSYHKKESVNILRSQKQEFNLQQNRELIDIEQVPCQEDYLKLQVLWKKKLFKNNIISIRQTSIQNNQLISFTQSYIKIITISTGIIQASLNIDHPLPIKWNIEIDNHHQLKQKIYQILKIIDHILKNHGYQMLIKDYKMINITGFMDHIKNQQISEETSHSPVELITSIYKPEDFVGIDKTQPSLKSLQAYKRVKNIKKNSEQRMTVVADYKNNNMAAEIQKEYIIKEILLHNHYSSRNRESVQKEGLAYELNCKLSQYLPAIQNKKVRHLKYTQAESLKSNTDKFAPSKYAKLKQNTFHLSRSLILNEKKDKFQEELENSNLRSILTNLNQKLIHHKKRKTKII